MSTLLIILLVVLILAALPTWPYSAGWGGTPSGLLAVVLIILVILIATGRL